MIIEGTYMVPKNSPLKMIADVDRPGVRIAVGVGSAYDLYLTRTIKNATIVRAADLIHNEMHGRHMRSQGGEAGWQATFGCREDQLHEEVRIWTP